MVLRHYLILSLSTTVTACAPGPECRVVVSPTAGLRQSVRADLLRRANGGRTVLNEDGSFVVPAGIKRVYVDVGAHDLEDTRPYLEMRKDALVIAIEPLEECWSRWPQTPRLIALPVAVFLERGTMDFHVTARSASSSLAESNAGTKYDRDTRMVDVRKVPVVRLEDVLSAIPAQLDIRRVDVDTQGADLAVLQSAGQHLRRTRYVSAEVMNVAFYKDIKGRHAPSEKELVDFMQSMGFKFVRDDAMDADRAWFEKEFLNTTCRASWVTFAWQRLRP